VISSPNIYSKKLVENLKQVDELFKPMLIYKKEESHSWSIITNKKGVKQVKYVNAY